MFYVLRDFTKYCLPFIFSVSCYADLSLDKVIVNLDSKNKFQEVTATNRSNKVMYLSVKPHRIDNPNTPNEKRVTDPNLRTLGLLVRDKFKIPANGQKKIRLTNINNNNQEEIIYRVTFTPMVDGIKAKGTSGVKTIIAYDVLVVVQPTNPKPDIVVEKIANKLTFTNQGNTNVLFFQGKQCITDQTCVDLPSQRLYVGNQWSIDLPYGQEPPVEFYKGVGKNLVKVVY